MGEADCSSPSPPAATAITAMTARKTPTSAAEILVLRLMDSAFEVEGSVQEEADQ